MKRIETERLILRPLTVADTEDVFLWAGDPVVNRYMPYPVHQSVEQTKQWLSTLGDKDEFGFCLKETGQVIGSGSIKYVEEYDAYELGYNLNRAFWGKGYATEAAKAMLQWAYEQRNARKFMARHVTKNTSSGNVIRKCGFQFSHYGQYSRYDGIETFDATYYTMQMK